MKVARALVTGGAAGLGAVIVRTLARHRFVVVIADRDEAEGAALVAELAGSGSTATLIQSDLADESSVRGLFTAVSNMGPLTLLVNNAGGWLPGPQFPVGDDWQRSLDLNLRLPMLATQLALPLLGGGGAVVNISSSGGWESGPYGSPEYGAAKAGLIRFTTATADFKQRFGVRVSCVVPHWIGLPRAVVEYQQLGPGQQADSGGLIDPQVVADTVIELARDPASAGRVVMIRADGPPYTVDPASGDPRTTTG